MWQVAERQGRYLSEALKKPAEQAKDFTFESQGMLAYVGGYTAISELPDVKLKGILLEILAYKYFSGS